MIPSGNIAAKVWNESGNKTPILALHGWMDSAAAFDNLCQLLDKDYPIYAVDFPGHGYSYRPSLGGGVYHIDYVVAVHKILHHLRWSKVILLGHSMGGYVSLLYTGTVPDVVEKVILIDIIGLVTVPAGKQPKVTSKSLKSLIKAEERNADETPRYPYEEILEKFIKGYDDSVDENAAKLLLARNIRQHEDGKYSFTYSPLVSVKSTISLTPELAKSYISRVSCDFLLIKSASSPLFMENDQAKEYLTYYQKYSKNFVLEIIEGTHHLHMTNPNPVAETINNFLHNKPQSLEKLVNTID
ncbi:Monoglyceride lipase [Armadillidium nasatum]|uniref:Monoglyceride lipase n=1 Tax=Armadillidium nasatum TaxID=96803 RepID=A0A5N5SQ27_9CRUS|nr:Monoglyceride lipase [Armadillidium nasatum]